MSVEQEKLDILWQKIIRQATEKDENWSYYFQNVQQQADEYIENLWRQAEELSQPPVIIFGEDHVDKDSFVWETALLLAFNKSCQKRGVNLSFYTETDPASFKNEIEYKIFTIEPNGPLLSDIAASLKIKVTPIDDERRSNSIELRDLAMSQHIVKANQPTFVRVGYSHLHGIAKHLSDKGMYVGLACALSPEKIKISLNCIEKIKEAILEAEKELRICNDQNKKYVLNAQIENHQIELERERFIHEARTKLFAPEYGVETLTFENQHPYFLPLQNLLGEENFNNFIRYKTHELYLGWRIQRVRMACVSNSADLEEYSTLSLHYAALAQLKSNSIETEQKKSSGLMFNIIQTMFKQKPAYDKPDYTTNADWSEFVEEIITAANIFPRMFADYIGQQNRLTDSLATAKTNIIEIAELSKENEGFYMECLTIQEYPEMEVKWISRKMLIDEYALGQYRTNQNVLVETARIPANTV